MTGLARGVRGLLDLLFPKRCAFCRKPGGEGLCESCRTREFAPDAFSRGRASCVVAVRYRGAVRDALHRFKFKGKRVYADAFAALMAQALRACACGGFDVVLWVPCSAKRRRERGYDQAELLAARVAEALGVPLLPGMRKLRDNPTQNRLKAERERRDNVAGVFAVADTGLVQGRHVLLVDDIITSGATVSEAARMLEEAGAASVVCVALAGAR